ncbi:MAG TPA: L-threonylcarbamoyladenylate synthase [Gaiellaceae bacterium]|nr:L-threonylcarbamoyladenylate synthase [Gaiellaceae bacterium]
MIDEAVAAMRAGKSIVLPTDTVYGLCTDARQEEAVRRLYRLKGREEVQPTALVAADEAAVLEALPELRGKPLLPGPYTLILPNPARRYPWLTGERPETIGVRLPHLPADAAAVVREIGVVAATSANLRGGPDPRGVDEIPVEIRNGCAVVLDAGELPGTPSTVIDLTGAGPVVLREGAVPAAEALARLA